MLLGAGDIVEVPVILYQAHSLSRCLFVDNHCQ